MDQLVKTISKKTGISEDQARTAVQEVISYVKTKLPPQYASYVDAFLSGSGNMNMPTNLPSNLGDLENEVGQFFGSSGGATTNEGTNTAKAE
jgi:uncharacterized protein (DUF2267 family)